MDCKVCMAKDCDCLCNTCKRARIIESMPDFLYEASDFTRNAWIERQMKK